MAGAKMSPRQKLINMMYLVLTALLALNVSKDVLEAFIVVNKGLESNLVSTDIKNEQLYSELDLANAINPKQARPFWVKAQEVKGLSENLCDELEVLKKELIRETEGLTQEEADTMALARVDQKDNYDVSTHIMIGAKEDGSAGKAREVRTKVDAFRDRLLDLLGGDSIALQNIGLALNDEPGSGNEGTWEKRNFHHTPLVASVTILSKLQNDIRNAEYYTIGQLYQATDKQSFPVDTVAAKVMPVTNYVMLNDQYQADIFLAAFSKTVQPQVIIGDVDPATGRMTRVVDTLDTENGVAHFELDASREGFQEYSGLINYPMKDGQVRSFPFRSEYLVARPTPVVSPSKMNVLYKGIENPVDISVPGVPAENVSVSISGGNSIRKVANGKYVVNMSKSSPVTAAITVGARDKDGNVRNMGNVKFRVKRLPKPYVKIGSITSTGGMRPNELIARGCLTVEYDPNFEFELKARVTRMKMTMTTRTGRFIELESNDRCFSKEMIDVIKNSTRGQKVYFENIFAKGDDGEKHELAPIGITLQ